mmetsp:Transcript_30938/g.71880  ORF Transcript_30938/g.71880 Transcript_30938/m.71880 type:complete len:290 (+) Transcript_30938:431-1300(+)
MHVAAAARCRRPLSCRPAAARCRAPSHVTPCRLASAGRARVEIVELLSKRVDLLLELLHMRLVQLVRRGVEPVTDAHEPPDAREKDQPDEIGEIGLHRRQVHAQLHRQRRVHHHKIEHVEKVAEDDARPRGSEKEHQLRFEDEQDGDARDEERRVRRVQLRVLVLVAAGFEETNLRTILTHRAVAVAVIVAVAVAVPLGTAVLHRRRDRDVSAAPLGRRCAATDAVALDQPALGVLQVKEDLDADDEHVDDQQEQQQDLHLVAVDEPNQLRLPRLFAMLPYDQGLLLLY